MLTTCAALMQSRDPPCANELSALRILLNTIKEDNKVIMGSPSGALIAVAGLLGGAGVGLAATAAHVQGSDALRVAAELAMVHAVAAIGLVAVAGRSHRPRLWNSIAGAMLLGAGIFSGSVSLGVLADLRQMSMLAPLGGPLTILTWLAVSVTGLMEWMSNSAAEANEDRSI